MANLDILNYILTRENLKYAEGALSGCNTLCRMVCNLLNIVRLEEGELKLREPHSPS